MSLGCIHFYGPLLHKIKSAFFNMLHIIKKIHRSHNHITVIALLIHRAIHINNMNTQPCYRLSFTPQRPQKLLHILTQRGHGEITWMNGAHLLTQTQCVHSVHPVSTLSCLMPSSVLSSPYSPTPALHPMRCAGKISAGHFWPRFKLLSSSLWITAREEVGEPSHPGCARVLRHAKTKGTHSYA